MQDLIWSSLEQQYAIDRNDVASWNRVQLPHRVQHLRGNEVFQPIGGPNVIESINQLLGVGQWKKPWHWGQFLIGFPTSSTFDVPHQIWHTDFGFETSQVDLTGVLIFSVISDVLAEGGGTLVIDGSHLVMQNFVQTLPKETRSIMERVRNAFYTSHPWLQKLTNSHDPEDRIKYFMQDSNDIDGVPVKVSQIKGKAGDVVVTHPWLLHASSPNCTDQVKMMRVHRIHRK